MPGHPINPGYEPGNHWAVCDRCGREYRQSELKQTWDGLVVCEADWEPRHPQDLVRATKERITPQGHVRPVQANRFTSVSFTDTSSDSDYSVPSGTFDQSL